MRTHVELLIQKIVKSNSVNNKIINGAFWSILGSLLPRLTAIIISIFLARIFGKQIFGELSIIKSTINMFMAFAVMGVSLTSNKYIAEYRNNKKKIAKVIALSNIFSFFFGFIVAILLVFSSDYICENVLNVKGLSFEFKLGAIILFLNSLNAAQNGILVGYEKFKLIFVNNSISIIVSAPIEIGLGYFFGIKGSLYGQIIYFLLLLLLNKISIRKIMKCECYTFDYNFSSELSILWKFTIPAALSGFIVTPAMWLCNAILVNSSAGFGELAIFEAANQLRAAVIFIPSALSQIILPMLILNSSDKTVYHSIFMKNLKLNFIIALFLSLFFIVFGKWIMLLFGKSFVNGYPTLVILMLTTTLIAINSVIGQVIASKSKMWIGLCFNFLWGIVLVILSWFFIDGGLGAFGLAMAFFISYLCHSIWQFLFIKKELVSTIKT